MLDEDVDFAPDCERFGMFADIQMLLPLNATKIYNTFICFNKLENGIV